MSSFSPCERSKDWVTVDGELKRWIQLAASVSGTDPKGFKKILSFACISSRLKQYKKEDQ